MILSDVISKSYYGSVGHISSQKDIDVLEQYIVYNLPVLQHFKNVIAANNYTDLSLVEKTENIWKKYFPNSIQINNKISRGHSFGAADNDDSIFDYCKLNNIEWLCKSANDIILNPGVLNKQIEEADFYYLNGIGYGGMVKYSFDFGRIMNEDFYPQTNFYFINVSKTDYLNDKEHVTEIYNKIKNISDYNGKAWEYGFRSCETLLSECVKRNNLLKYHLIPGGKYLHLLQFIKQYNIHDSSHKNIMIENICHYHFNDQETIKI